MDQRAGTVHTKNHELDGYEKTESGTDNRISVLNDCPQPGWLADRGRFERRDQTGSGTRQPGACPPHLYDRSIGRSCFLRLERGGDSWAIEEVSEGYFYAPMDIVVDGADNIHIAYHDHDFEDLAYAFSLDGQWSVEAVSHPGHDGWDPSLAIGPDGTVHVVAIDPLQFGTNDGIEYYTRRNDEWSVEGIGSGGMSV